MRPEAKPGRPSEAVVSTCPGCGGHLGDTWDADEDECGVCGFAYVSYVQVNDVDVSDPNADRDRVASPFLPVKKTTAATVGWMLSLLAGGALAESTFVSTVATPSGPAITMSQPGGPFYAATVLGFVGMVLITYGSFAGDLR